MDLTAILACKDREKNVAICLASINSCVDAPKTILVDFGSKGSLISYEKKYSWLKVIRVKNNTELFHKTRALNIGIKQANTKYICLTDVDQIFQPNFFTVVEKKLIEDDKNFIRCKTYFLPVVPKWFNKDKINWQTYRNLVQFTKKHATKKPHGEGCCHGTTLDWLLSINGHDEKYIGWGYEDKDLSLRAEASGFKMLWVDKETSMVHFPHPRNNVYFSSNFWNVNKKRYLQKVASCQVKTNLNSAWGML